MGYITPAEFRVRPFGIALRQYTDDLLSEYIEIASANVDSFTERHFSEASYSEVFRGDGSKTHLVYQYPIVSITEITQKTIDTAPTVTTLDTDRLVRTSSNDAMGRIELDGLDNNISSFGAGNLYTVEYVGGYATVPVAVKHATALWVSELLKPDFGGAQEEVPEIVPLTNQQIADLLVPLRRRRIG
jgi:hypothetical protein